MRGPAGDGPGLARGLAEFLVLPEPVLRLGNVQRAPEGLDPALVALAEPLSSCIDAQETPPRRLALAGQVLKAVFLP